MLLGAGCLVVVVLSPVCERTMLPPVQKRVKRGRPASEFSGRVWRGEEAIYRSEFYGRTVAGDMRTFLVCRTLRMAE